MPRAKIMSVEQFWKQVDPDFLERPKLAPRVETMLATIDRLVLDLHTEWMLYLQLFSEPTNWDLLRRNGSLLLVQMQRILADSVLLALARLADPKRTFGCETLSVCRLFQSVSQANSISVAFTTNLEATRDRFLQSVEQIHLSPPKETRP